MAPRAVAVMFSLGCFRGFCIGTLDFAPGKLHPQYENGGKRIPLQQLLKDITLSLPTIIV